MKYGLLINDTHAEPYDDAGTWLVGLFNTEDAAGEYARTSYDAQKPDEPIYDWVILPFHEVT